MNNEIQCPRLPLFVPGIKPDLILKAVNKGAESIIVDLEDAVAEKDKHQARLNLNFLAENQIHALVRINNSNITWYKEDLEAVSQNAFVSTIVVPKAETVEQIDEIVRETGKKIIPLIETAKGIDQSKHLAQHKDVLTLSIGHLDLALSLGCSNDFNSLMFARSQIVFACALAMKPSPIDGITENISNSNEITQDCLKAKDLGFGGKLLIHPSQIAPAKKAFRPTIEEYDLAKKIVEALPEGGVTMIDGKMIDAPVVERAKRIIEDYKSLT